MQTRKQSLVETSTSIVCGFLVSYLVWLFIIPWWFKIETNPTQGIEVTLLFTVSSFIRSYVVRRFFNRNLK